MANKTKNILHKSRDYVGATDAFDALPECEKIRYSRKRRKGAYRDKHRTQR